MDQNLLDLLRRREISEEIIKQLSDDKIDAGVIPFLTEEELIQYFPRTGDRVAIRQYCKNKQNSSKKNSLLDKLRSKLNKENRGKNIISSDSDTEDGASSSQNIKKKKNAMKNDRQIEIGWFCGDDVECKQVHTKCGGGTRKLIVPKEAKKNYIIEKAKNLFFPNGESTKGPIENYNFDLLDFKSNSLSSDITVQELFTITGLSRIRFYLASTLKSNKREVQPDCIPGTSSILNVTSELLPHPENDADPLVYVEPLPPTDIVSDSLVYVSEENNNLNEINLSSDYSIEYSFINNVLLDDLTQDLRSENNKYETMILPLHRGQVFQELINAFCNIFDKNINIQIEMYLPNGKKELGLDMGGIFRDSLSEFWNTFYEKCTSGTTYKVPILRHDFDETKWKAVAKIFYKGYVDERYFPIKLAPSFIEYCIFGNLRPKSNITKDFLKYLNGDDAEIIKSALENWQNVDLSEVLNILDSFECKWAPTSENIAKIINDIAHKEIIQKPMFVIDSWQSDLCNLIDEDTLHNIYQKYIPTAKNILANLKFADELTGDERKITDFFKKFIKESDLKTLECLIRFCTGSDILTNKGVTIIFNLCKGITRTPIGHTCSFTIELSSTYENYPDFRLEMNSVLNSNIWVMDIV